MSSGVLAGHREQLGSGGKIVRGRRLVPSFSPYSRPSSSTAPLPLPIQDSQSKRRPSWIFGVISGAGKLISSVLGSDGGGSSLSESSSDYESDENYDSIPDECEDHLFSDNLTGYGMTVDRNVDSLTIVPKSEMKLVIQELLMQETFTRDECNKMMEIIQSRVIEIPYSDLGDGKKNEALEGASTKGASLYLDYTKNFSRASNISTFSSRHYSHGATSPDIHNKAVIEAKKWFEEKKLSPMAIHDQESEPVGLNTKANQYHDFGSDGSPIEVAKSYMQALPPWRSPSFSNVSFKTRPPIGKHSSYDMGSNLLPTSKDSEKHRTFLKSVADEPQGSQVGCSESPTRVLVLEASRLPPEIVQNGNKVEEGNYKLHDGNVANIVHQMATDDHLSECDILQPKEKLKESLEGVKMPVQTKEQRCASSASQNSGALASVAGDSFLETEILQPENVAPAETSSQQNYGDKMILGANNFLHVNANPGVEHAHSKIDGKPCMLKDTNESTKCIESNGHLKEIKANSAALSTSKGDATTTYSSNEGAAEASISSDNPSTRGNSCHASDPNNGATMNSSEPLLSEPAGPSKGKRRVKKVVRQKKWRG
ncbi:hypothetical protein HPP92_015370 [Vanilla planifolia]|uniref:Protein KAKU4 n=1 Tax=Vanilla planifolia TaxID=51239 RepID=A0A835UTM0_VANPL|nr:hypothetical protein HPP92_015370 [Vanilla planifolia]